VIRDFLSPPGGEKCDESTKNIPKQQNSDCFPVPAPIFRQPLTPFNGNTVQVIPTLPQTAPQTLPTNFLTDGVDLDTVSEEDDDTDDDYHPTRRSTRKTRTTSRVSATRRKRMVSRAKTVHPPPPPVPVVTQTLWLLGSPASPSENLFPLPEMPPQSQTPTLPLSSPGCSDNVEAGSGGQDGLKGAGEDDGEYEWLYVNDEEAMYVGSEHVQSLLLPNHSSKNTAYILFYKQKNLSDDLSTSK